MASKADMDNHSNQLNPNNHEYDNSRGWGQDDDNEEGSTSGARGRSSRISAPLTHHNEEFSLGVRIAVVSLTGRVRYIAFRTSHVPILKSANYIASARIRNEDYADLLLNEVARQLKLLWRERKLATYILYSENGRQIVVYSSYVFPAALSRGKPELQLWIDHGKAAVESAHALLSVPADAQIPGIEDWGTICDISSNEWTSGSPGLHRRVTELLATHPDNWSPVL